MIELSGDEDFQTILMKFLVADPDELEMTIEQLDMMLSAAEYAQFLSDTQTTH